MVIWKNDMYNHTMWEWQQNNLEPIFNPIINGSLLLKALPTRIAPTTTFPTLHK